MLPQLLTTTLLLFAPPPELTDPPPVPEQSPEFTEALQHLAQTESDASSDPIASADQLIEAVAALAEYAPEVATSPVARDLRRLARLNLARAYLLAGDDQLANATMDEAIREAMGADLMADEFGPSLDKLYEQRLEALEQLGRADLLVTCPRACKVYVNETAVDPNELPRLLPGTYRVWIEDPTGDLPPKHERVELSEADEFHEITFAPVAAPPQPKPPPKPKRIMPRGAEIALMLVGAGLTATGAVLVARNNTLDVGPMIGGVVALAVGAGTLTAGTLTLSVDERKLARATAHQATLSWTIQF